MIVFLVTNMNEKKLSQFLCDYLPDGSTVEIDARWLQRFIREANERDRLNLAQLAKYRQQIDRLKNKVECCLSEQIMAELETNIIYKINIRA